MTPGNLRHPRGLQPVAAVRRRRSVRARPAAGRGGRGQWRRVGAGRVVGIRQALGLGGDGGARPRRQREHAETAHLRFPRQPPRRGRVSSGLSRIDGAQRACRRAQFDLDRRRQAGRRRVRSGARGEILHGRAGRDRASLPDHHDARLRRGAGRAAGSAGQGDAGARHAVLRSGLCAVVDQARHDARHGHDREAGRHRRPFQHDAGGARRRRLPHHRAQMVHVGADVRRLPGAGAGR